MPNGLWTSPDGPDGYDVAIAGEYILITLRNLPLSDEGSYRFELALGDNHPLMLEIPVFLISTPDHARIH